MAVWQFDLQLVRVVDPKNALARVQAISIPFVQSLEAKALLNKRLGEPGQMLPGWLLYGTEGGDRVDCVSDSDGSVEFSARIDARECNALFVDALAELAARLSGVWYSPDDQTVSAVILAGSRRL